MSEINMLECIKIANAKMRAECSFSSTVAICSIRSNEGVLTARTHGQTCYHNIRNLEAYERDGRLLAVICSIDMGCLNGVKDNYYPYNIFEGTVNYFDVLLRYFDFLVNRSPYKDGFLLKDASLMLEHRVMVMDPDCVGNILVGGLIQGRHSYYRPTRLLFWDYLVRNGVEENLALFISQTYCFLESGYVQMNSALSDPHISAGHFSFKALSHYLKHNPQYTTSPLRESTNYYGVQLTFLDCKLKSDLRFSDYGTASSRADGVGVTLKNKRPHEHVLTFLNSNYNFYSSKKAAEKQRIDSNPFAQKIESPLISKVSEVLTPEDFMEFFNYIKEDFTIRIKEES